MNLETNLDSLEVTEFGIGRDEGGDVEFVSVPVDANVQAVLEGMVAATRDAMNAHPDGPAQYAPSEKHASTEYLSLPVASPLAAAIKELHDAQNLPVDTAALEDVSSIFCYFVRVTDTEGHRLTAVRRSAQFKLVANNNRLVRVVNDSLRVLHDRVFKLDADFDLLVDSDTVHIWHPVGFEFVGRLQEAILEAVPTNIAALAALLPHVDFESLEVYASIHPRAARYLASIRSQPGNVSAAKLRELCLSTGVTVTEIGGILRVPDGSEMAFLEVLDRRRYELDLVPNAPEKFRAASRSRLNA